MSVDATPRVRRHLPRGENDNYERSLLDDPHHAGSFRDSDARRALRRAAGRPCARCAGARQRTDPGGHAGARRPPCDGIPARLWSPPAQGYPPPPGYAPGYPPPQSPAFVPTPEPTHDGVYVRLDTGGGFTSISGKDSYGQTVKLSGSSFSLGVAVGGGIAPNLALFGNLFVSLISQPDAHRERGRPRQGSGELLRRVGRLRRRHRLLLPADQPLPLRRPQRGGHADRRQPGKLCLPVGRGARVPGNDWQGVVGLPALGPRCRGRVHRGHDERQDPIRRHLERRGVQRSSSPATCF